MKLEVLQKARHLKYGVGYFVKEAGSWRVVYSEDVQTRTRRIKLIAPHKEYEKWFKSSEFFRTFFLFVR